MDVVILPTTRLKPWCVYTLVVLVVLYVFLIVDPVRSTHLLELISPFHIGMPRISGTVVDAMTGRPLPGMDVCLLATVNDNFVEHNIKVMRSETTQTDASGRFSFPRWSGMLDLSENWGYGITVTDPAALWKQKCGSDVYLLGGQPNVLQRELDMERQHRGSRENNFLPYFPVALVVDPNFPYPPPYGQDLSWFPTGTLVRKMDDPRNLKITLIPFVLDEKQCQSAPDSKVADLCEVMNESYTADDLRKILTNRSVGR
jgi:hypothetical protein